MSAAQPLRLISVEEYLNGELVAKQKHEYADGHVYAMAGARNVHNIIVGAFFVAMYNALRGRPCQPFNSDTKVRIRTAGGVRFYYPDGMVVCDPNAQDDTFQDEPVLIAEVLSESTRRIDEREKRDTYFTIPTLAIYLLIETDTPRITVYRRQGVGFSAQVYEGLSSVVPLDVIQVELRLAELYERVDFIAARNGEADVTG